MELDFDKEIDTLLRQTAKRDAALANGNLPTAHLDADEISAFAENTLPEKAKQHYVAHLGDCDSCRKNLSELILLNADNEVETVQPTAETATVVSATPWYRKLFIFPNLAYTMGALVLAFTGLTAFIVLQNFNTGNSEVAQSNRSSKDSATAPLKDEAMTANKNVSEVVTNTNSEIQSNSTANITNVSPESSPEVLSRNPAQNKSVNETDSKADSKTANELREETDSDLAKLSDKDIQAKGAVLSQDEQQNPAASKKPADIMSSETQPAPRATVAPSSRKTEPVEKKREILNKSDGKLLKDDASTNGKAKSSGLGSSRQINGKTFERKDGVWYDSAYRNQQTTNVRRGTNEYRNLDSGLRSIADNLGGTVVIVWKATAYRIQ